MNEQRQQAYSNLIQSLLNCPSHDEVQEILVANQNLLDVGFLQAVEVAMGMFSQQGYENTANWLQGLAMQLKGWLNRDTEVDLQSLSEEEVQVYLQFLMEVLQTIPESNGEVQVLYSLLAKNADKLDGVLAEILRRLGRNILREAEADQAKYLAAVIFEFSNLIAQFPLGNKASNMEIAITGYELALTVYTQQAFPYEWAMTLNSLANAYRNRITGERADNLEIAIVYFQNALIVRTFDAFPQDWAMTQNNLANAYSNRIRGERAENLEQAIACYHDALKVYTFDAFPQNWAMTQNNLANAYSDRIRGERAENLEQAIACYHDALKVCTFDACPQDWAMTQNNLACAYSNRIRGEQSENFEQVIACFQNALKFYTFDTFPQDWAATQNNLGVAYSNRISGEWADNLEQAIACFQNALKFYTFDAFPQDWAATQNNLANAYRERIRGEWADNLERAIDCCQNALKFYTFDAFPQDWAGTQNNLGAAYGERIRGERAQNWERAIACFQNALKFFTFDAYPQYWAMTQNSLGLAYGDRITGKRADNLERAIDCYQQALKVYTFDAFPQDWAGTQNNLGSAYCKTIGRERANNLELAIVCFQNTLKVRTFDAFPVDWAMTQNNLGAAYYYRIRGEWLENLELAIACLQEALKVYTFDAFPKQWAGTQNILGLVYGDRIRGEWAQNLEQAITCFQEALKVYTFDAFPQKYAETLFNLGMAYQSIKHFTIAYNTFECAIATVESLREEIVSGEESKLKQAEEWNKLYSRMVEVCLKLGKFVEAIEYVERSKTRNLVELILERDRKTIFPPEVVTQLEKYRDEIATGQAQIQNGKAENPKVLAQRLQELRQHRNELQNRYLPVGYGFNFDSFQASLDERTAIIEWYILNDKILAFIVTRTGEVTVWQSQPEDREAFGNWVNQYLQNYYNQKEQWQNSLGEELKKLASILHIDEILTYIPNHCDQLILIPHRFLHLFPLHALPVNQNSENSRCLLDLFPRGVSYAPSCQLLQQVQMRQRPDFQSLFAIQNPTQDLSFTDLEVESILSYFPGHQVLLKEQATKAALSQAAIQLKQANYLHFSCHGSFNFNFPQNSFLLLADAYVSPIPANASPEIYLIVSDDKAIDLSKCLTLGNLFERNERGELIFDFSQSRLVVLSACETGLIDFNNTSDEYIGLPSGFLYAGSSSVVSSLWTVNDLSTSFLVIKFIQILKSATDMSVPLAMNQAQLWLRDATKEELHKWADQMPLDSTRKRKIRSQINKMTGEKPLNSPYHWAAFTAVGK
ncbi:TPR repeat-containing protein [Kalymmatonema gypsitolerans NIES-4073]|nr:TPR repeat-containing protein [Scytonema sp. NIES-4073]